MNFCYSVYFGMKNTTYYLNYVYFCMHIVYFVVNIFIVFYYNRRCMDSHGLEAFIGIHMDG